MFIVTHVVTATWVFYSTCSIGFFVTIVLSSANKLLINILLVINSIFLCSVSGDNLLAD